MTFKVGDKVGLFSHPHRRGNCVGEVVQSTKGKIVVRWEDGVVNQYVEVPLSDGNSIGLRADDATTERPLSKIVENM